MVWCLFNSVIGLIVSTIHLIQPPYRLLKNLNTPFRKQKQPLSAFSEFPSVLNLSFSTMHFLCHTILRQKVFIPLAPSDALGAAASAVRFTPEIKGFALMAYIRCLHGEFERLAGFNLESGLQKVCM
jgi:hypothetical protein